MKNLFQDCDGMDSAQALFRDLAKKLHPDLGGDPADFRGMMDDFQEFQRYCHNSRGREAWGKDFKPKDSKSFYMDDATLAALQAVLRYL